MAEGLVEGVTEVAKVVVATAADWVAAVKGEVTGEEARVAG